MYLEGKNPTIRQYLMSLEQDKNGRYTGYQTDFDDIYGDFKDFQQIIDNNYQKFFDRVYLTQPVTDRFKKDFCVRFYNKPIEYETFEQFFYRLSDTLNTKCFNLIKMLEKIRNAQLDEQLETTNVKNKGKYENDSKGLGLVETRPDTHDEITYSQTGDELTIKYANDLSENRGANKGKNENETTGRNTRPLYQEYDDIANMVDIEERIFNIVEDVCFSKL